MTWQFVLAIATFVMVTAGTPGPNNLLLLNSGAQIGIRRTLPLLFGINHGVVLLVVLMLMGLGELFVLVPETKLILKFVGGGYLLYLAFKVAFAPINTTLLASAETEIGVGSTSHNEFQTMRWHQAVLFQFVNPKVWMMAITAAGSFTLEGDEFYLSATVLILGFMTIGLSCNLAWAVLGTAIKQFLSTVRRQRGFNIGMGIMVAATIAMII